MSAQPATSEEGLVYGLPGHVRWCTTGSGIVFLDLQRNRYFGLGADQAPHLQSLLQAQRISNTQQAALAKLLMERGLLTASASCCPLPEESLPKPTLSIDAPAVAASLRPGHWIRYLLALRWAKRHIDRFPLYTTAVELLRQRSSLSTGNNDTERAIELALAFRSLRPYLMTARERCLLHALTLTRFLALHQLRAHWVIGVQTHPWKAHSWVQLGTYTLDATPEEVVGYAPILVV
ncbi:hypothetical protein HNQ60_000070 [Povalibacter uvarum]|uniref:Microcin J25-processing protein McjB C-terminal domain-containing protein n=1 Tax=Povalibacter uvarum TaxID=732238 RepID=A0A841HF74_9GAMM|nr:lasso peptide biosynthesis B2 protein [Povalibacter uvarum]MBB6091224.1 hypothetical protein [Povalibacter uvarum]